MDRSSEKGPVEDDEEALGGQKEEGQEGEQEDQAQEVHNQEEAG